MIPNADLTALFSLEHSHSDGSSHPMELEHHDPAQHDPERSWLRRHVYRCLNCKETVELIPNEEV